MKKSTIPTTTSLVTEALDRADDFVTMAQLVTMTGRTSNQVSAALIHLRNHHRVDTLNSEGQLFWYSTPGDDNRQYERLEYSEHTKRGRRKSDQVE